MSFDRLTFGKRMRLRRRKLGIKQKDLAERLGRTDNFISALENGKVSPSIETLMQICDELQITPDYLLLGSGRSNNIAAEIVEGLRLCKQEDVILLKEIIELMVQRNSN